MTQFALFGGPAVADYVRFIGNELVASNNEPLRIPEYTVATAPAAAGNKGAVIVLTDVTADGYCPAVSTGKRWLPLSGGLPIKVSLAPVTIASADSCVTNANRKSAFKWQIPFSAVNGSFLKPGDVLGFTWTGTKSGTAGEMRRNLTIGTDATNPINNNLIAPDAGNSANAVHSETVYAQVQSATNAWIPGRSLLNPFDTTGSTNGNPLGSVIPSLNSAVSYFDFSPRFQGNGSGESVDINFAMLQLWCFGIE